MNVSVTGVPQAGPALTADLSMLSVGYHLTGFMWIVPLCLLWYDIMITMDAEVKYFWSGRGGLSSWLFFINRYWPAANLTFHNLVLSWKGVSPSVYVTVTPCRQFGHVSPAATFRCTFWFQYTAYATGIEHMAVMAILIIRIYAMFDCNKKLLVGLITLYAVCMTTETILIGYITHQFQSFELLRSTFTGCAPVNVPLWCWAYWIPSVVFESTMFLLAMYKTMQEARGSFSRPSKLMIVLLKDSIVYFGGVITITLFNFLAWYLQPLALYGMFIGWHICIQSILGCRMLLNIREAAATTLVLESRNLETIHFVSRHKMTMSESSFGSSMV